MSVFLKIRRSGVLYVSILILVAGSVDFDRRVFAQAESAAEDVDVILEEVSAVQGRFDAIQSTLSSSGILEFARGDATGGTTFFDVTNLRLWIFWVLLLGIIVLLFAMRVSLSRLVRVRARFSQVKSEASEQKNIDIASAAIPQAFGRVLVNPVKVVRIKVRKIKKLKKHMS